MRCTWADTSPICSFFIAIRTILVVDATTEHRKTTSIYAQGRTSNSPAPTTHHHDGRLSSLRCSARCSAFCQLIWNIVTQFTEQCTRCTHDNALPDVDHHDPLLFFRLASTPRGLVSSRRAATRWLDCGTPTRATACRFWKATRTRYSPVPSTTRETP